MSISTQRDIRATIISRIWAYATVMLSISILLTSQERNRGMIFLPATIVFGATISTIVVLRKLRHHQHDALLPSKTLDELKQRVENLEAIAASDARHWDHSLKQIDRITLDCS